jgi:hypothetical protein
MPSFLAPKEYPYVLALSLPVGSAPIPKHLVARQTGDKPSVPSFCSHEGNSDFYGLGIRLGIYLQVFCTMLCMMDQASPDALYDAHDANAVLLLAVFVAIVKATPSRDIELVDVIIMLRMLWLIVVCGFSLAHLTSEWKRAKETKRILTLITTPSALLFRIVAVGFISIYNVWFWYRGIGFFQQDGTCTTYAFFWARLPADGRLQTFNKFISVVLMVTPPSWILAYIALSVGFALAIWVIVLPLLIAFELVALPVLGCVVLFQSILMAKKAKPEKPLPKLTSTAKVYRFRMSLLLAFGLYRHDLERLASKWTKIRHKGVAPTVGVKRAGTIPVAPSSKLKISTQ